MIEEWSMAEDFATIGQRFIIGFNGHSVETCDWKLLEEVMPSGVVLFARNIGTHEQLRDLIVALKARLPEPLIVAIDQEGRRVNRLRGIIGDLPAIAELKREARPERVRKFGRQVGATLREFGFTMDFAPVLDLGVMGDGVENSLPERCWGRTSAEVVKWAGEFLDGLQAEGITGCGKHFPGLGHSTCDSHDELPVVKRTRAELDEDALPFRQLASRLPVVMVGHACYPAIASVPASLSRKVVTGWLREEIGYKGLIVTDDMEMGALVGHCSMGEAAVAAIKAGVDKLLVCHSPEKILEARDALRKM